MGLLINSVLMEAASAAEVATDSAPYSVSVVLVYVVGFIAAATIGSIAWYNSKRPVGWEDKERPDIVPDVKK